MQSSTADPESTAHALRAARQLAIIEAIAGGRYDDATRLLQQLLTDDVTPRPGRCRYCGCTQLRGCAVVVPNLDPEDSGAVVARCAWIDEDRTVCSNLYCLEQLRAEAGQALAVEPVSRIERPSGSRIWTP